MSGCIGLVAARYPVLSETFVLREVQGLSAAGMQVRTLSLHDGEKLDGVPAADCRVYGRGTGLLAALLHECLVHPAQSGRTFALAVWDALSPGEPTSIPQRAKLLGQAVAAIATAPRVRPWGISHLHCHFAHASTSVGMYLAAQLGVPFSFVGHANDLFQRRCLLRRKLQRAAFVSCISQWHRDLYISLVPGRAERYHVIRCGVDVDRWHPRPVREASRLNLISVCRLVEKKGMDTLLKALGLLRLQGSDVVEQLTIVGDGPQRRDLEVLAQAQGITGQVRFAGSMPNDQVRLAMIDADAFVLPCREDFNGDRDGIPVVLMEAMACGVPVVSGDLPAIRELIQDGETGLLVDGKCPKALAECIVRLCDGVTLRHRLTHAALEHVRIEFSLSANIARLRSAILNAHGEDLDSCPTAPANATA